MADFKTHISASNALGIGYGVVAYGLFDMPIATCLLAGGLCGVSGMLPDLDSDSGRPLRESLAFSAAIVPMMMVPRFEQIGLSREMILLSGAFVYLLIRFGIGDLLRRYTVHRGMFHSLPAALIAGELAFLLASGNFDVRLFKASGVMLGYVTHLVLDEIYSFHIRRGRLRVKKSFGTALKMVSNKWWPNISTYGKLGLLTFILLYEPTWMEKLHDLGLNRPIEQIAIEAQDRMTR